MTLRSGIRRCTLFALCVGALSTPIVSHAQPLATDDIVTTFADESITESSALVAFQKLLFTVNDSGSEPVLYAIDSASGETMGTTTYTSTKTVDTEALAMAPDGAIWVGDIGGNTTDRSTYALYRVPEASTVGMKTLESEAHWFTYPSGRQDAETLLINPATGEKIVVTKNKKNGEIYALPDQLSRDRNNPSLSTKVGNAAAMVTDGVYLKGGNVFLLRTYTQIHAVKADTFETLGSWNAPIQPQGESIAITEDNQVIIGSEGKKSSVVRSIVPLDVAQRIQDAGDSVNAAQTVLPAPPEPSNDHASQPSEKTLAWAWFKPSLSVTGVLALLGGSYLIIKSGRARK